MVDDSTRFRDCQAELGLTNQEMARALRVGLRTVIHWRVGDRKVPGPVWVLLGIYRKWPHILEWVLANGDKRREQ